MFFSLFEMWREKASRVKGIWYLSIDVMEPSSRLCVRDGCDCLLSGRAHRDCDSGSVRDSVRDGARGSDMATVF